MSESATYSIAVGEDDGLLQSIGGFFDDGDVSCGYFNNTDVGTFNSYLRYIITIPKYATIATAYLTFTSNGTFIAGTLSNIAINNVANAVAPTSEAEYNALSLSSPIAYTTGVWSEDTEYSTPELKTLVQGIVDKPDYEPNNAILFTWKDNSSPLGVYVVAYSYDFNPAKSATLYVRWEVVEVPDYKRGTVSKQDVGIYDYGKKPYMTQAGSYTGFQGEITDTYVKSLGYDNQKLVEFKKPYLFSDFHSMMYLFDTPEKQASGSNKTLNLATDMPRVDDDYFDSAQQVASLSNFNTYAQENYIIMGKTMPTYEEKATASEDTSEGYTCSGVKISSSKVAVYWGQYSGGYISLSIKSPAYAAAVYRWEITSATYGSLKDDYTGNKGTLTETSGWNTVFTPPYTDPGFYMYVTISLYVKGYTSPCDDITITVYPLILA